MQASQTNSRVRRESFLGTLIETAGAKGIILTSALLLITVVSYLYGIEAVEGPFLGAVLTGALATGIVFEDRILETDRGIDRVGVSVVIISAVYTLMEVAGMQQGYAFPLGAGTFLFGTVLYDYWRNHSGTEELLDFVEFLNSVDITGLYGSELLYIYTLLYVGGQTGFLFTPHFPALILVFMIPIYAVTSAYMTGSRSSMATRGLHKRLISVLRSLDEVKDEQMKKEVATEVRPLSNAINGVQVPSKVADVAGHVPIVLPVYEPQKKLQQTRLNQLTEDLKQGGLTGYVIDSDDNMILFKRGKPIKYYLKEEDEFGHDIDELDENSVMRDVGVYSSSYSMVDSIDAVTPSKKMEEEDPQAEEAGQIKNVIAEKSDIGSESGESEPVTTDEDSKINVGGNEVNIDEMFEKANEMFDE